VPSARPGLAASVERRLSRAGERAVDRKPQEIPAPGFFQNLMVVEGVASGRKYL
jgi:hypothetical protein